jgi:RimJ/RimL family protein N-acetyltransferase
MSISLRPLRFRDWPAVHRWAQREEACRYQAWGPNTPAETAAFVQTAAEGWTRRPPSSLAYAVNVDGEVRGLGVLHLRAHRQGEIAYGVHPDLWGRGVATQLARELVRIGFTEHDLHRIAATCDPRNVASARVLAKIGMAYEGRLRECVLLRDGWRDSDLYSLLRREWALVGR